MAPLSSFASIRSFSSYDCPSLLISFQTVVGSVMVLNQTFLICFIFWTWCIKASKLRHAIKRTGRYEAINDDAQASVRALI